MSLINDINLWFKDYDLAFKAIYTIAAPGGIWFLIDKFRNRIRIKVRKLGLKTGDTSIRGITFEAENVSSTLTSFEPNIILTGYSPERKKQTYTFIIDGNDRHLPPHISKQFISWHSNAENKILLFLWYMTFQIPLSRGRNVRIRFRNSEFKPIGIFRFHLERLKFLWFGKVPEFKR